MQTIYDLVIENGTLTTSAGSQKSDIAIKDGKIAAVGGPFPAAAERIDAKGLNVMPGFWHVHCHFREPGHTYKEDFGTGTKAAAAGGVTFCVDMTNNDPHPTTLETFEMKKELIAPKAYVDYGIYGGGLYPRTVEELAKAGAIGIKIFNTRHIKEVYPYISELGVLDHGILYELYEATADTGLIAAVHHDDPEWAKRLTFRDYINKGKTTFEDFVQCHKEGYMYGHGMVAGLASSLYYASLTDVKLHVLHMGLMPKGAFELVRHAKFDLGQKVTSELDMASMVMSDEQLYKVGPKTCFTPSDREASWENLANGVCDIWVLEHAPHKLDEVEPGWKDMFSVPLGGTGVQEFVSMALTQVNQGKLTLEKLAEVCCESPAKLFGQYPNKGSLEVGTDADITIIDMNKKFIYRDEDMLSRAGYTTWVGLEAHGAPVYTIVRGGIIMKDGVVQGEPGYGKMVRGTAAAN